MRIAVVLLGLATVAAQSAVDPFVAQRNAAAALNPLSTRFTIALPDGRRTFRVGEPIPLTFTYDEVRNRSLLRGTPYTHFAESMLDRVEGAARPQEDFQRARLYVSGGVCGCVEGGVVGSSVGPPVFNGLDINGTPIMVTAPPPSAPPKPPPVRLTFLLNEGVRFDAPGRYRVYIADGHDAEYVRSGEPRPAPLVSNIITLDIVARDPDADERTARLALSVLDRSTDTALRIEAAGTLKFIGSQLAIEEMARRLFRNNGQDGVNQQFVEGLLGVADREHSIASTYAQLEDVGRPVPFIYLATAAALKTTRDSVGRLTSVEKLTAIVDADTRRLRAFERAGKLVDELAAAFRGRSHALLALTPALGSFVPQTEAALRRIPRGMREEAIRAHQSVFSGDSRFVPLLKRQARVGNAAAIRLLAPEAPTRASPQVTAAATAAAGALDEPPSIVSYFSDVTGRREYFVAGVQVPFHALGAALRRYPRGTTFEFRDRMDEGLFSWTIDTDGEVQRVRDLAAREGMSLRSR